MKPTPLELLAPARNALVARTAILAGADAVYIGGPGFGARAAAGNSIDDIRSVVEFAHQFGARVYVTMNTILYPNELQAAKEQVWALYKAGVDALIVQDMAFMEMDLPPIALHASTQCDIRTPEKAVNLARAGFSQLVLPREFSLEEIRRVADEAKVPVEVFIHGALCVSYSGDCQAGCVAMGRSANRGECPQMCRLKYSLIDEKGQQVDPPRHYLSLADLNQIDNLEDLANAGASSFKIEGRLKDARYVANVVSAYRLKLDGIISANPEKFCRSSFGKTIRTFEPDLNRTFNRGYTTYFLRRPTKSAGMASIDTPKWRGVPVGKVKTLMRDGFRAQLTQKLTNGDGLGFFDATGNFIGFRLNRVDGDRLYPANALPTLQPGMELYRNHDKAFFDVLDSKDAGCKRLIRVDLTLRAIDGERVEIEAVDERGCRVSLIFKAQEAEAQRPQTEFRARTLGKLGDTIYTLGDYRDEMPNRFIAASVLADAKREVINLLNDAAVATYRRDRRAPNLLPQGAFSGIKPLTYHDNVANALAEKFYKSYGAGISQHAVEVEMPSGEVQVMETRYCIRRELGACLKDKNAKKLPTELYLKNESGTYRLQFDCQRCGMKIFKTR